VLKWARISRRCVGELVALRFGPARWKSSERGGVPRRNPPLP
jgi:hypothetical protein